MVPILPLQSRDSSATESTVVFARAGVGSVSRAVGSDRVKEWSAEIALHGAVGRNEYLDIPNATGPCVYINIQVGKESLPSEHTSVP